MYSWWNHHSTEDFITLQCYLWEGVKPYMCTLYTIHMILKLTLIASFMGQHGAHLGPTGPRWAPCWPHELCYLGIYYCGISFNQDRACFYRIRYHLSETHVKCKSCEILLTHNLFLSGPIILKFGQSTALSRTSSVQTCRMIGELATAVKMTGFHKLWV